MRKKDVLGIDVSKKELVVFDSLSQKTISVSNTVKSLKKSISDYGWNKENYCVGLESTGDYSFLAMRHFVENGFDVYLLNPIVTKKFLSATVRNKKTDKSDAQVISQAITIGEGRLVDVKELKTEKKTLIRLESKLGGINRDLKRIKKSAQEKVDNGIEVSRAVSELEELIKAVEKAKNNIWQEVKKEKGNERQEEIIASHVGCGERLSTIISAEAGDLKRFPTARQFKAYIGIDPKIRQSGSMNVQGTKMTKRGNPILRQALFLAAFVASQHDPQLKSFYEKKKKEGKPHIHAVCAVERKLCERIYATVTQNRLYEVRV